LRAWQLEHFTTLALFAFKVALFLPCLLVDQRRLGKGVMFNSQIILMFNYLWMLFYTFPASFSRENFYSLSTTNFRISISGRLTLFSG